MEEEVVEGLAAGEATLDAAGEIDDDATVDGAVEAAPPVAAAWKAARLFPGLMANTMPC